MSQDYIELDMRVPEYHMESGTLKAENLLCIPVVVFDQELTVVLALDTTYSI